MSNLGRTHSANRRQEAVLLLSGFGLADALQHPLLVKLYVVVPWESSMVVKLGKPRLVEAFENDLWVLA